MSDFNFTIRKVFPGTEKQKAVGIYATFSMTMDGPDGIILSVNDMKLMKSQEGKYYIDSPFRTYDSTNDDGSAKKVKVNYVKFFPEKENWDKQTAIVNLVMDELAKVQANPNKTPSNTTTTTTTPRTTTPSRPQKAATESW